MTLNEAEKQLKDDLKQLQDEHAVADSLLAECGFYQGKAIYLLCELDRVKRLLDENK